MENVYSPVQLAKYLNYIDLPPNYRPYTNLQHSFPQTEEALTILFRCQITRFPYDNLTVHYSADNTVDIHPQSIYTKLLGTDDSIPSGRGGYCLECSIFFHHMLRALGFSVYMTGVRNRERIDGIPQGEFKGWTHIVNIVQLPSGKEYHVDAAFGGDGPTRPLPLISGHTIQNLGTQAVRLIQGIMAKQTRPENKVWIYQYRNNPAKEWNSFYSFTDIEFFQEDFEVMNRFTSWDALQKGNQWVVKFIRSGEADNLPIHEGEHVHGCRADVAVVGKVMFVNNVVKMNLGGQTRVVDTFNTEEERKLGLKRYSLAYLGNPAYRGYPKYTDSLVNKPHQDKPLYTPDDIEIFNLPNSISSSFLENPHHISTVPIFTIPIVTMQLNGQRSIIDLQLALPRSADELSKEIFLVLRTIVLAGDSFDPVKAADEIDIQCLGSTTEDPMAWDGEVEQYLSRLWVLMMALMERVPYNHRAQYNMIKTLMALYNIESGQYTIQGQRATLWKDLPMLAPRTVNADDDSTTMSLVPNREVIIEEEWRWVNVNSFAAKIFATGMLSRSWLGYVVATFTAALEVPDHPQEALEVHLAVVHQWIEDAGCELYRTLTGELSQQEQAEAMVCGPLYDGNPRSPRSRWRFWKGRLVDVRMDVEGLMRSIAMRTSLEMGRIEVRMD